MNSSEPQKDDSEQYGLFTVAELIRMAFSGKNSLTINFKLIHIILLVLAKKLNVLDRMVQWTSTDDLNIRDNLSNMSLYETKLLARKDDKKHPSLLDFEKERIIIVYVPPEESKSLSRRSGESSQPYTLSLTSQASYLKLVRKIEEIQGLAQREAAKRAAWGMKDSGIRLDILARRLDKTEQSIQDLLGSIVMFRESSLKEQDDDSLDLIFQNTSHFWDLGDKIFVMRQSAEVVGPFVTAKPEDTAVENADQVEPEQRGVQANVEEANREQISEYDIIEDEVSKEQMPEAGEAVEGEAVQSEAVVGQAQSGAIIDFSSYRYVPCHPISMYILKMKLIKIKRDMRKEFRVRLAKIQDVHNSSRDTYFEIKDEILHLHLRAKKKPIQELEEYLTSCKERHDAMEEKRAIIMMESAQFLQNMQLDLELGVERFNETLNGLQSDLQELASLDSCVHDLRSMLRQLEVVQGKMVGRQIKDAKMYTKLLQDLSELNKRKCPRKEFVAVLENKASCSELNGKMRYVSHWQQMEYLRKQLNMKMAKSGVLKKIWQKELDKIDEKFFGCITEQQINSLRDNVWFFLRMLNERVDTMLKVFETEKPFGRVRSNLTRAIHIDKECISCSTKPRETIENRKERGAGDGKNVTGCVKKVSKDKYGGKTPCAPLTSVSKEARSRICLNRGKKPCEEDEDIREILKTIIHSTPIEKRDDESTKKETLQKEMVQKPCKPCNKPKKARKAVLKPDCECSDVAVSFKGNLCSLRFILYSS